MYSRLYYTALMLWSDLLYLAFLFLAKHFQLNALIYELNSFRIAKRKMSLSDLYIIVTVHEKKAFVFGCVDRTGDQTFKDQVFGKIIYINSVTAFVSKTTEQYRRKNNAPITTD